MFLIGFLSTQTSCNACSALCTLKLVKIPSNSDWVCQLILVNIFIVNILPGNITIVLLKNDWE